MDSIPTGPSLEDVDKQHRPKLADLSRIRLAMAILWTVVILVLCWLPSGVVKTIEDESSWFEIANLDKFVHAGIFAVFSVLWIRAWSSPRRHLWAVSAGAVLAVVTEVVQNLPAIGRDASIPDAVTDLAGALIGVALAPLIEPVARRVESWLLPKPLARPLQSGEPSAISGEGTHPAVR